jgi:vitamin B12 transporter
MKTFSFAQRARVRAQVSACAAACASLAATSFAQTSNEPQLQPVVVTASRNPQLLTDTLPHTTVISAQDINNSPVKDLPSLLSREAGVQITQSGGLGTSASLFMRGSASLQVLVLLDGIPLTKQDASGAVSLEHIALDQIDRIEIIRGNVSAIYGTGAVGGVVQLLTKSGSAKPSAAFSYEAGPRSSSKISWSAQGRMGEDGSTKIAAGLAHHSTDGISAVNVLEQPGANADRDGYRNRSGSFSISQDLAKGHTLGLRLKQAKGRFEYDNPFGAPSDIQRGTTQLQTITLYTDNRITADWLSRLSWAQSTDKSTNFDNGAFGGSSRFASRNRSVNWLNTLALGKHWSLTAGLDQQHQAADVDDGFGGQYQRSRSILALYAGLQGQIGAHSLQLNVRNDAIKAAQDASTYYLGYGYTLSPQWKLLASSSTAFNIAPLGYLFDPSFGNPALKPERAQSHELGLQWSQGSNVLRATLFDTRSRDVFEFDFSSNTFQNVAKTKNRGVELSFSGKLGSAGVRTSLTAQKPQDSNSGQVLNRRAKSLMSVSVSQPVGAWRLGADLRYSGARRDGSKRLGSYEVLDVSVRYAFHAQLQAYGRIENLLDRHYQTVSGYNQIPRSVFVGLQWTPQW